MATPVRPEDMLPADVNSREINGVEVRKGSVAAFVANARQLDRLDPSGSEYAQVASQLRALVPALRAVGVLDVFTPRSGVLAELIESA
jgi:hypothetical protein